MNLHINPETECPVTEMAGKLAALSHPARLSILRYLSGNGACCCKQVVDQLDLAQSTVSQHLKILVEARLVTYRPEHPRSRYTVDAGQMAGLSMQFSSFLDDCAGPAPVESDT